ncbi:hypothetical protein GCM10022234_25660 [Aeromicrobium panaciterrae]|uniref:hypothetical protein n=1 Tax=Aeromicrobium panaciterrae TaxID=363861 RepID=UPI0031D9355E
MSRLGLLLTTISAVVAAWIGWTVASAHISAFPPSGDRVLAAVAGLKSSHVYVDPDSEGLLTPAEIARIDAAAAASRPEVFVIIWRESSEAGYYLPSQALDQIGAELDRPGYYISAGAKGMAADEVGIKSDDYVGDDDTIEYDDGLSAGELATGLLAVIDENDGREFAEADTTGSQYWGGRAGTIAAGAFIGTLAGIGLAGVLAIAWFVVRTRRGAQ